jgi:hypothetical protein
MGYVLWAAIRRNCRGRCDEGVCGGVWYPIAVAVTTALPLLRDTRNVDIQLISGRRSGLPWLIAFAM